jgi:hypothetical protein
MAPKHVFVCLDRSGSAAIEWGGGREDALRQEGWSGDQMAPDGFTAQSVVDGGARGEWSKAIAEWAGWVERVEWAELGEGGEGSMGTGARADWGQGRTGAVLGTPHQG